MLYIFHENFFSMQKLFKIETRNLLKVLCITILIYLSIDKLFICFFHELFPLTAKMYLNFIDKALEVFNIFMTECHFFIIISMNISKDGYFFRIGMQWKLCL